jgi:transcriptional regulator with XRE-family HTH domain
MNTIYQTIKELRMKHGKTQADIAFILDLDTSTYGKLERGNTDIT